MESTRQQYAFQWFGMVLMALLAATPVAAQDVWSPACVEYVNLSTYAANCTSADCCSPESLLQDCGSNWWWGEQLTLFMGIEGSKQPQDYGVNANLGIRGSVNWAAPL